MNTSSDTPGNPGGDVLRESPADFSFDLPVDRGYRELPPKGSWEAGYRLSLAALELVKDRPEVFEERDRHRCEVEFRL